MPIPLNNYFDPTAVGSNLGPRGYGNLAGADVFFYVSQTNEIRVKQANASATSGQSTIQILVTGVKWLSVIQQPPEGVVHLYWSNLAGAMFYTPYTVRNFTEPVAIQSLPFSTAFTFSTTLAPNGSPAAYCMLVDDGVKHTLYTSINANFAPVLASAVVYNNNFSDAVYVNMPVIAVHPQDTNIATINTQVTKLPTPPGVPSVGFYVATLPGVNT